MEVGFLRVIVWDAWRLDLLIFVVVLVEVRRWEVVGNCCWWWRVWNGSGRNGQVWVGMEMGCC